MKQNKFTIFGLLIFLVISFTKVSAQSDNSGSTLLPNLTVGAKTSYMYSYFSEDHSSRFTDFRKGYSYGIAASYYVLDWVAAGAEFYFMEYGANDFPETVLYLDGSYALDSLKNTDIRIRMLDIPILATIHIPDWSGDMQPKFIIGPAFGINLNSTAINERSIGANDSRSITKDDVSDHFKRMEYATILGVGVNYKMGSLIFSVEARARLGLSNIHNKDNSEQFNTNTFMITLGVGL